MLYEDLTKQIIGAVYKVYNTLGYGYKEKEYQRALATEFEKLGLKFQRELHSYLKYEGTVISRFFVDFLVDQLIVVEVKVAEDVYQKHFQQLLAYLTNHKLKVGLLTVFTSNGIKIKRVMN
jgi:GxxExxY protein